MWFERFVIIVVSLQRDFLPSAWSYSARPRRHRLYIGTIGFFMSLFLLFFRLIPVIAMAEVKAILPHAHPHHGPAHLHAAARPGDEVVTAPAAAE